ncbi:ABC transporter ATP-binding protein [Bifidobacterium parmae]|uniref:ABC transporter ATP-binding protein n=1 Tax=Bifidobacterium parmae TaxID=361854 RepID=A0A2N5IX07_9BIFI|nr:ABC transporter ATP-binding protein [Bifidobacterium parmae]PLS26492.1 ABC transporter ATP-binding protein [Bifidobacterium parmae]
MTAETERRSPDTTPLLRIDDLTRTFTRRGRPFDAVSHVTLELDAGGFVAIVGRSGNGKSTLINMIAGLVRPTGGSVEVDGLRIADLDDRGLSLLRNRTIGFVTQEQTLLGNLPVLDNVILPATFFPDEKNETVPSEERDGGDGEGRDRLVDRALRLLERLGVDGLAGCYPRELSGGEMRRVSIARALVNDPKLIIADEPTGDLDADSTTTVMRLLRERADSGVGVLMVTHDADAIDYADTVYRMDAGTLSRAWV